MLNVIRYNAQAVWPGAPRDMLFIKYRPFPHLAPSKMATQYI